MQIDEERQRKAREYARLRRWLSLTSNAVLGLCAVLLIIFNVDKWLRDQLQSVARQFPPLSWQPVPSWYPLQILLYFLIVTIILQIVTLPLSYYQGFVLSHRYGLSVMTLKAWFIDRLKGGGLGIALQAIIVTLIYALLAFQPQTWWLWVAICQLFFSVVLANLAPVIIFPLFYKFSPLPDGELKQRLLTLAQRAGTSVRGVYTMHLSSKTTAANAAVMGLGNTRRIVLGDTMTDRYSTDEIEVVLAHELGHHVHNDMWKALFYDSLLTLGGLFLCSLILHFVIDSWHYYLALTDPATLLFLAVLAGLYGLIIAPLSNLNSRRAEYQADEYALRATGKIASFKNTMARLANQNLAEIEPSPIVEFLFYSHPSITRRLKHADDFAQRLMASHPEPS
ncbi:MAG: M48 family metallopeptidase [Ktedonobacteraceae bacterium]|nr:M48 family metallopeptidase [Ktedonobacteraceae bacterium]